ncbi:MAG: copper-binding protein [Pseudomonadota bacterium]
MKSIPILCVVALAVSVVTAVNAQAQAPASVAVKANTASAAADAMANGEVLKVYPKERTLLLKHGPIPSIGMGPMTMEYGVKSPKMLSTIKPGDKIRFTADQVKDQYVVTHIEVVK